MRKLGFALATAATMAAPPAMTVDDLPYVAIEAGMIFPDDIAYELPNSAGHLPAQPKDGWDADILAGHDFGAFRIEGEVGYKSFDIASLAAGTVYPRVTGTFSDPGDVAVLSSMVNGLIDFGGNDLVGLSFGGGVGIAGIQTELSAPPGTTWIDSGDVAFAWQGIAALRIPVSNAVDLGVKYRYFKVEDVELVDRFGTAFESDLTSHSVLASLMVSFGGPKTPPLIVSVPPAPPPPPPPPASTMPPPPPMVHCSYAPFIVFFDWDKSDITPEAATVLDNAVTAYGSCGAAIMLAGHTDKSGSVHYNMGLAARRTVSVQTYLTGRGIPGARIASQAFGESMPRVPTADGVRELQNRRVEIAYGPGSGR